MSLEGWVSEGEAGLRKWFRDHYKWAPNEEAAAEVDREDALRNPVPAEEPAPEAPVEATEPVATDEAGAATAADASAADTTTTEGN